MGGRTMPSCRLGLWPICRSASACVGVHQSASEARILFASSLSLSASFRLASRPRRAGVQGARPATPVRRGGSACLGVGGVHPEHTHPPGRGDHGERPGVRQRVDGRRSPSRRACRFGGFRSDTAMGGFGCSVVQESGRSRTKGRPTHIRPKKDTTKDFESSRGPGTSHPVALTIDEWLETWKRRKTVGMSGCQSNCLEGWLPLGAAHSLRGCSGSGAGEESGKWGWRGVPVPCHCPWPMAPVLQHLQ